MCADGQGFGHGYTYPSLDGHQMTDALLWLGRVDVVKANWDHVRSFQRPDGSLPIAILPNLSGKQAGEGDHLAPVAANGGLYAHWVPGNPLQVLAGPTDIQNADDIFRMTLDLKWLTAQLPSVNLSADHLASLVDDRGAVRGAGYYIERPARIEYDGVAQCHAVDAFRRVASLNRVMGDAERAKKYEDLAAMGRVWHLDAQARARMGDAEGLLRGIRRVCEEGAKNGYYWRERYQPDGRGGVTAVGPNTYCEYPANLIRIVQRFLFGVEMLLDGSLVLAPAATGDFWRQGFGQTLRWRGRALQYRMQSDRVSGTYEGGGPQKLAVRLSPARPGAKVSVLAAGLPLEMRMRGGLVFVTLAETPPGKPCKFEIARIPQNK